MKRTGAALPPFFHILEVLVLTDIVSFCSLFAQMWQKQIESEAEKKEGEDVLEEKLID